MNIDIGEHSFHCIAEHVRANSYNDLAKLARCCRSTYAMVHNLPEPDKKDLFKQPIYFNMKYQQYSGSLHLSTDDFIQMANRLMSAFAGVYVVNPSKKCLRKFDKNVCIAFDQYHLPHDVNIPLEDQKFRTKLLNIDMSRRQRFLHFYCDIMYVETYIYQDFRHGTPRIDLSKVVSYIGADYIPSQTSNSLEVVELYNIVALTTK